MPFFKLFNLLFSWYRVAKRSSLKIAYSYFIPILIRLINSIRDAKLLSKLDIFIFSRFSQPFFFFLFFFFHFFFYFFKRDRFASSRCILIMKDIIKKKKRIASLSYLTLIFFFFFSLMNKIDLFSFERC